VTVVESYPDSNDRGGTVWWYGDETEMTRGAVAGVVVGGEPAGDFLSRQRRVLNPARLRQQLSPVSVGFHL